jgi:hypothetical protein
MLYSITLRADDTCRACDERILQRYQFQQLLGRGDQQHIVQQVCVGFLGFATLQQAQIAFMYKVSTSFYKSNTIFLL